MTALTERQVLCFCWCQSLQRYLKHSKATSPVLLLSEHHRAGDIQCTGLGISSAQPLLFQMLLKWTLQPWVSDDPGILQCEELGSLGVSRTAEFNLNRCSVIASVGLFKLSWILLLYFCCARWIFTHNHKIMKWTESPAEITCLMISEGKFLAPGTLKRPPGNTKTP